MSTVTATPITSLSQLDPDGQYTYADYLSLQFQERVDGLAPVIEDDLLQSAVFPDLEIDLKQVFAVKSNHK